MEVAEAALKYERKPLRLLLDEPRRVETGEPLQPWKPLCACRGGSLGAVHSELG